MNLNILVNMYWAFFCLMYVLQLFLSNTVVETVNCEHLQRLEARKVFQDKPLAYFCI